MFVNSLMDGNKPTGPSGIKIEQRFLPHFHREHRVSVIRAILPRFFSRLQAHRRELRVKSCVILRYDKSD